VTGRVGVGAAAADHLAAIEELARVVEDQDPDGWTRAPQPGKWSPAEIAQHLILSYGPPLAELDGGAGFAVRVPWWKRAVLRWTVLPKLLGGAFPRGAPAPREIRPKFGAASPAQAARDLRESAARFAGRLAEREGVRRVRLTHPYFGKLSASQILTLMAVHAGHHRAQFPQAPPAPRGHGILGPPRGGPREGGSDQ
jgi:DinB superfamily